LAQLSFSKGNSMIKYNFFSTSTAGVRYREHPTRRHGKKLDRYYYIRYQRNGKTCQDGLGWASKEKITQAKAAKLLTEITANIREGSGPQSLKEKRAFEQERRQDEIRQKQEEAEAAAAAELKNITFSDAWDKYYEYDFQRIDKKEATSKNELSLAKKWILPTIGRKRLCDIVKLDLERLQRKVLKADMSFRTLEYVMTITGAVFNYAIENKHLPGSNPVKGIKRLRYDNQKQRFLTKSEATALLTALKKKSLIIHDLALMSLHTAARGGELFVLQWQSVDIESGRITLTDTKNGDTRHVYASKAIKEMLNRRQREAEPKNPLVFPGKGGHQITGISRTFDRVIDELGFNNGIDDRRNRVTFHSLRHTAASWAVQAGVSLFKVQKLLGHRKVQMTQRYSHLEPEGLKIITEVFDDHPGDNSSQEAKNTDAVNLKASGN